MTFTVSLIIIITALVTCGLGMDAFAFHSGGVAECVGCHQMHDAPGANLLIAVDQSSTCLDCHGASGQSSYHVATPDADMPAGSPPVNETPGGDFGWLHKSYYFTIRGGLTTDLGETHGHNIIAAGYTGGTYAVDPKNATAPGGTFPSAQLNCISCHDQHGKGRWTTAGTYSKTSGAIYTSGSYGSIPSTFGPTGELLSTGVYRLLRAMDTVDGVTFPALPPVAVVPSTYNRSEYFFQTRTAYGSGMSDWCSTCHPDMHTGNGNTGGIIRHPTDRKLTGLTVRNYNNYTKSGVMTGNAATSYLSLVPFEEGLTYSTANINTLKSHAKTDDSYLNGPDQTNGSTTVFCLSCHRAHASGWPKMLKWNPEVTTITLAGAYPTGNDAGWGRTLTEVSKAYYDKNVTRWSAYQRSLCNKCHAKD